MKFEISFEYGEDNYNLKNNAKEVGITISNHENKFGTVEFYEIELNTAEDFQNLVNNIEDLVKAYISLNVSFNNPCIFINIH